MFPTSFSLLALLSLSLVLGHALVQGAVVPMEERAIRHPRSHCKAYAKDGLLKLENYNLNQLNGTVLAEGTFSAATDPNGNANLRFTFDQCNLPFMHYTSGTSRNSGGSMGAPLEYFGHVRTTNSTQCLTANSLPSNGSGDDGKQIGLRLSPCSYKDDETQLRQFFVYSITATGQTTISYVGQKNTTKTPYQGFTYRWTVGKKPSKAFPKPILLTKADTDYALLFDKPSSSS